jgi:DNA ligase D-like protein (predicted 3'-phosphoesterase)
MLLARTQVMAAKRAGARSGATRTTSGKRASRAKTAAKRSPSAGSTTAAKRGASTRGKSSTRAISSTRAKSSTGAKSSANGASKSPTKKTSAKSAAKTSATGVAKRGASSAPLAEYNAKRDFSRTAEPAGKVPKPRSKTLHFVIQKHAASHLHYDFRLELDGVMKSWAVPKGPSLDPTVRRLAMEVEDHPISYNTFEGTIPQGEYGGGTVMLWDRGTYEPEDGGGAESLRRGYEKGELRFQMHGKRLQGGFVLARLRRPGRPQWLLIKRRDDHADPDRDITAEETTSVASKRSMEEIAAGRRVWHSNR